MTNPVLDMTERKWKARTKRDLMIEVWEALDCESVGAEELREIEKVVRHRFGDGAVESPARVARILADEGAELRHPEVLELDVEQRLSDPYAEMFRGLSTITNLEEAADSIKRLEELRKAFTLSSEKIGLRRVREVALNAKQSAQTTAGNKEADDKTRVENSEIVEWLSIWLQQPELFDTWLELRQGTEEFRKRFGAV
jgi:hypothetical protein